MKLVEDLDRTDLKSCVATIGFFDGVHVGHQFLIGQVIREAQKEHLASMAVSFAEHPRRVMQQAYQPRLLSTPDEKCARMKALGLDYMALLTFDEALSRLTARQFMQQVLYDRLKVRVLVVGYDHRFGRDRAEGFEDYVRYGQEIGIRVVQARPLLVEGMPVSSSMVRAFVEEGEMEHATRLLGCYYAVRGKVVDGYKVGRKLGFPTANLQLEDADKLLPACGVYAVRVELEGILYKGMLNIGNRPTLDNGKNVSIEVHLLHFSGDIYNQLLTVEFVSRLRSERRFRSAGELSEQLKKDALIVEDLIKEI